MKVEKRSLFAVWIFLLALILRLIPVILLRDLGIGLDDMFQYDMLARSLVAGNGYRWYAQEDVQLIENYMPEEFSWEGYDPRGVLTSFRPPLYPAFLALVYSMTGVDVDRFFTARLVQAFLNAALIPVTYFLARRMFPGKLRVAQISAWVMALYPMMVIYPMALATENLFFLLVLVSFLALLRAAEGRKTWWFVAAGVSLGLTCLTRSVALAFAGLSCLWVWFVLHERRKAVLLFLAIAAITLPWMVRNSLLHGRLMGIESALGYDLYVGYHPELTGTIKYPVSLDLIPILDDGERDEIGRRLAWGFIQDDPGRFPYLVVRRMGHFFGLEKRALTYFYSNDFFGYIPQPLLIIGAVILLLPFMIVSSSAAFGLGLTPLCEKMSLLVLFFVGYVIPHALILGEDRFHLTLVPFLCILAANLWTSNLSSFRERWSTHGGRLALTLAGIVVILLLFNWGMELYRDADMLEQLFGTNGNRIHLAY